MVLVDPAYDGEAFRLHENHFGESLRDAGWTLKVAREPGATVMLVFIDVFGNELRHLN